MSLRPLPADLAALVKGCTDELVAVRRDLHAHPELSWAEHRTASLVAKHLEHAGLDKGPVFRPVNRWEGIEARALTPQAVNLILKRRCALAGLDDLTTGSVFIGDTDLSTLNDRALTKLRRDRGLGLRRR